MQEILQLTAQFISLYFEYIVGVLGTIGVIYTIVSYYKARRGQKPRYMTFTSIFQSKMIQNSSIEVIHSGNTIQDFAVSTVAIWNAGTTIKREDVATKDPLHISMSDDAEILEAQLLFSEKQNDITWQLSDDKKSIVIDLEYLAKKEGFVMKVFHTGTKSNSLTAGCSLTSGKNLTKSEWGLFKLARRIGHRVPYHRFRKIYGWMIVIMCLIVAAEVVLAYNKLVIPHSGGLTSAIIQTAVYLSLAYYAYRTFISPRLPKKLTRYFYGED